MQGSRETMIEYLFVDSRTAGPIIMKVSAVVINSESDIGEEPLLNNGSCLQHSGTIYVRLGSNIAL